MRPRHSKWTLSYVCSVWSLNMVIKVINAPRTIVIGNSDTNSSACSTRKQYLVLDFDLELSRHQCLRNTSVVVRNQLLVCDETISMERLA